MLTTKIGSCRSFAELTLNLEQAFEEAREEAEFVIERSRDSTKIFGCNSQG